MHPDVAYQDWVLLRGTGALGAPDGPAPTRSMALEAPHTPYGIVIDRAGERLATASSESGKIWIYHLSGRPTARATSAWVSPASSRSLIKALAEQRRK